MISSPLAGRGLPFISLTPVALSAWRSSDLIEARDWLSNTNRRTVVLWFLNLRVQLWGSGGSDAWIFNVSI